MIQTRPISEHGDAELILTMPDGRREVLTSGDVAEMDQMAAVIRDYKYSHLPPTDIITVPELACCDSENWLADELQRRVTITSSKIDGHYDVFGGRWVERELCEVQPERFWVLFPRGVLIPTRAYGCIDRVEWEAELLRVSGRADGLLAEYAVGGAN